MIMFLFCWKSVPKAPVYDRLELEILFWAIYLIQKVKWTRISFHLIIISPVTTNLNQLFNPCTMQPTISLAFKCFQSNSAGFETQVPAESHSTNLSTTHCCVARWSRDMASVSWWIGCQRCPTEGSPGQTCGPPRGQPQVPGMSDRAICPAWLDRSDPAKHQQGIRTLTGSDMPS